MSPELRTERFLGILEYWWEYNYHSQKYMLSLYNMTVPVFVKNLKNLSALLEKAEKFAEERGFDANNFLSERLIVDQFPFVRQVQIVSDNAKGTAARLAGMEPPKMEDTEASIAELKERIAKTISFLETVTPEQINGQEERPISLPFMPGKHLPGLEYVVEMALPNFYFHLTTAYSILRRNGVVLGKADYIGQLNLREE